MRNSKPLLRLNELIVGLLALVLIAAWCSNAWWPLEFADHLRPQFSLLALLTAGWMWWQQCKRLTCLALLLMVGFGWPVWQWAMITPRNQKKLLQRVDQATSQGKKPVRLTAMVWNFYRYNPKPDRVVESILQQDEVDVLYLTEVTEAWRELLKPVAKRYPHQLGPTDYGNWLLSKHPLEKTSTEVMTYEKAKVVNEQAAKQGFGLPVVKIEDEENDWWKNELLFATVNIHGKKVRFGGVHPATPISVSRTWEQRVQTWFCREKMNEDPPVDAKILMGDFNTSPFSDAFARVRQFTGLRPSAEGRGFNPTWGLRLPREPILPWFGVQIDHIFVSDNLAVTKYTTGLGSDGADHRWIKSELWLVEEEEP